MRNAQVEGREAAVACEFSRLARQPNRRSVATLAHDFDFDPSDVAIPPGTERLHRRFFRREAGGITLIAWTPARFAIRYFAVGEDTRAKTCTGQRTIDRPLDAIDLD